MLAQVTLRVRGGRQEAAAPVRVPKPHVTDGGRLGVPPTRLPMRRVPLVHAAYPCLRDGAGLRTPPARSAPRHHTVV